MASGEILNLIEEHVFEDLIHRVEINYGPIEVCLLNLGAQIGTKMLAETTEKQFTLGWKMTQLTLFKLSKVLLPKMTERKKGTLIVTSSTASVRGNEVVIILLLWGENCFVNHCMQSFRHKVFTWPCDNWWNW